jgi:hypothetical protein
MKKRTFMGVMALIAAMILSVGGTCFAQDTVFVDQTLSGMTRVFTGLAYSTSTADADGIRGVDTSGQTAYGIISGITGVLAGYHPATANGRTGPFGATPFAVADLDVDNNDLIDLIDFAAAPAGMPTYWSSASAYVQPAVISGETNAFVVIVQASNGVENGFVAGQPSSFMSGASLVMIDGATMTINWDFGIPEYALNLPGGGASYYPTFTSSSETPYFPTQLTVWTPGTVLDATGATIYGTSGTSNLVAAGASVWAITNGGAMILNGTTSWPTFQAYGGVGSNGQLNVSDGLAAKVSVSGISGFLAAPVISGESVFYVGYGINGGITVYQLDKDDLGGFTAGAQNAVGGVIYAATVKPVAIDAALERADRFMPTPVTVTNPRGGVSLVVVCNQGGVSVYDTQDLAIGGTRTAGYVGNILNPLVTTTGVTASPVVWERNTEGDLLTDPYIIMCGSSAVSCYQVSNGLATNTPAWTYSFAANISPLAQVWGTPAVTNGFVYVPVVWGANGTIFVFDIDAGNNAWVARHDLNGPIFGDPIAVNNEIWGVSVGQAAQPAQIMRFEENGLGRAFANPYWTQFKFDAGKKGDNTLQEDDDFFPGSSGCFISTVK